MFESFRVPGLSASVTERRLLSVAEVSRSISEFQGFEIQNYHKMMIKKPIFIVLGILVLISLYFLFFHKPGNIGDIDFNIKDTSVVSRLVVSHIDKKITIEKVSGHWMVDNIYHANQALIRQVLRIFKNVETGVLVPESELKNQIDTLKQKGIHLQLFEQDKLIYQYWIGNFDETRNSTIILNDNDIAAYVTAPGLTKNIRQFVEADDIFWRDRQIFSLNPENITEVSLEDLKTPANSFVIEKQEDKIQLYNTRHQKADFKEENLLRYMSYFGNVSFESLAEKLTKEQQDSVLKATPVYKVKVKTLQKQSITLNLYQKFSDSNPANPDLNFIYGNINNENILLLISYFQIDPVLKSVEYFKD